jgi:hypothetical protein
VSISGQITCNRLSVDNYRLVSSHAIPQFRALDSVLDRTVLDGTVLDMTVLAGTVLDAAVAWRQWGGHPLPWLFCGGTRHPVGPGRPAHSFHQRESRLHIARRSSSRGAIRKYHRVPDTPQLRRRLLHGTKAVD